MSFTMGSAHVHGPLPGDIVTWLGVIQNMSWDILGLGLGILQRYKDYEGTFALNLPCPFSCDSTVFP